MSKRSTRSRRASQPASGCGRRRISATLVLVAATACSKANNAAVDAALSADDPCVVEKLTASDVSWLNENDKRETPTGAQSRSSDYEAKVGQCKFKRNQELRIRQCADAGRALLAGQALPTVDALGEDERAFVRRIATGHLTGDDIKRADQSDGVPCGDTPSRPMLRDAFVNVAARGGAVWLEATPPPTTFIAAVRAKALEPDAAKELLAASELKARSGLSTGKRAADLEASAAGCGVVVQLGAPMGPNCSEVEQKYRALTAAEEAARKRAEAQCEKLRAAREACEKQCEGRLPKDDLGFADFDKGMDCSERCEKAVPMTSCE